MRASDDLRSNGNMAWYTATLGAYPVGGRRDRGGIGYVDLDRDRTVPDLSGCSLATGEVTRSEQYVHTVGDEFPDDLLSDTFVGSRDQSDADHRHQDLLH
jgi:hypothetical protein